LSEREQDVKESGYRQIIEAALSDEARSGRPADFTAEQLCQIIAVAVQEPQAYGCPVSHWTPKELAQVVIREGIVSTISPRHIGRFLKGVRPETASVTVLAQQ
jgi:putative transposase